MKSLFAGLILLAAYGAARAKDAPKTDPRCAALRETTYSKNPKVSSLDKKKAIQELEALRCPRARNVAPAKKTAPSLAERCAQQRAQLADKSLTGEQRAQIQTSMSLMECDKPAPGKSH